MSSMHPLRLQRTVIGRGVEASMYGASLYGICRVKKSFADSAAAKRQLRSV